MTGLAFAQAPPPSHPLRFLVSALCWGVLAGLWLLLRGDQVLASRWAPATLVLVHVFALGVLGNAMVGSLYQFLPVAAGSPLRLARLAPLTHVLFNLGIVPLLAAFLWPRGGWMIAALALLLPPLLLIAATGVHALVRGSGARATRTGIALALACLCVTVLLGARMLAILTGHASGLLVPLADLHAAFGIVGWVVGLLASVASITVPMLQGTRSLRGRWLLLWWAIFGASLGAVVLATRQPAHDALRYTLCVPVLLLCLTLAVLQWNAPRSRNSTLRRFWIAGLLCLGLAAIAPLLPLDGAVHASWIGTLALMLGLPWLVIGMLVEIVGFLAWIELRRRHPRGVRVPGVGRLMEEAHKRRLWWLHVASGMLLLAALALPTLVPLAGLVLAAAHAATLHAVVRSWRDALHFQPPAGAPGPA